MLVWINYTAIHVFFVSYWAGQSTAVLAVMEPCLGLSTTGILHQPVDQLCVVLMYAQMSLYWIRFVCVCVFLCCNCPNRAYVLTLRFLDHTHTHTHTPGRTPLIEWSASRKSRYLHSIQETQATNISAVSGIWTRDLSNHVAADLRLRQHYH